MRPLYVAAIGIALLGIGLPPARIAEWLTAARPDLTATVTTGAWWFKALLLLHAVALWALGVYRASVNPAPGLAATVRTPGSVDRRTQIVLAVVLAVGLAARLPGLDQGLWYDEIATLTQHVRLPVAGIVTTYESQNQHPVYSLAARVMVGAFGEHAWALRLPAVAFGLVSLLALWAFGRRVASSGEALLATALLAVSYHHIWFSQNARGYTGLLLWTLVMSVFFLDLVREAGGRERVLWPVAAYAAAAALGLYTNPTAGFVLAAHGLIWLVLMARRGQWRTAIHWRPLVAMVLGTTVALQLYALVLPQFMGTLLESGMAGVSVSWKNPLWFLTETVRGLAAGVPGGMIGLAGGAVVGVAGLWALLREDPVVPAVMLLPAALLAAALVVLDHNLWPRLFFFSFGFGALIVMRGLGELARPLGAGRARLVATAAGLLLVAGSAATVPRAWGPKQDYEAALRYVDARRAPDDAVVTVDLTRYPYTAYLPTDWIPVDDPAALEAVERAHRRTWVLYTFPTRLQATQPAIWDRLGTAYREVATFPGTVGGGDIVVMLRG